MFRGQHLLSQVSWGLFASRIPWSFKNSIWGLLLVRVRGTWEQHHPTLSNPWWYMVFHAVLRTLVPKISAIWSQQPRANSSAPSGMSRELIFMLDRLNLRVFLLAYLVWTLIHFFARIGRGGSCELYPDPDPLLQRLRCFWPSIFPYGCGYKYKAWIKVPGPHTIHTPWSIPRSIPHDTAWSIPEIHTPDPYPWSVPLSRWRKTDAGPNAAFYPNTTSGPRTATPVATTVVSTAASAASARCLRCLRCLRAAAAAAATTSHLPPRSCCYCCRFCCCSCWSCSRCWCWFTSSVCFW